jgi:hypothetical protein
MTTQPPTFDVFAIVELFGHARIAGRVTEQVIAGQGFIRVDVPELPTRPAFTRLYGPGAIYSITPVSNEIATAAACSMRVEPVNVYIALPSKAGENMGDDYDPSDEGEDDDEEDNEDDNGEPF